VLDREGKYVQADAEMRHMIKSRKNVIGPDHPDTLGVVLRFCVRSRASRENSGSKGIRPASCRGRTQSSRRRSPQNKEIREAFGRFGRETLDQLALPRLNIP
jgi:hypothetical protein